MYVYDNRIILLSNVARVSKLIIMKILYHLRNKVTGEALVTSKAFIINQTATVISVMTLTTATFIKIAKFFSTAILN